MFTPTKYPTAAQYLHTQQLLHEKDGGEFDKMYPMAGDIRRMLNDLKTLNKRYDILEHERDFYRQRVNVLEQNKHKFREPELTMLCDILANGALLPDPGDKRYGHNT